jgi:hypothetical protein
MRNDSGIERRAIGRAAAHPASAHPAPASPAPRTAARAGALWPLRAVTAAALAVDAYVHADVAPNYDFVRAGISEGTLFRAEAGAAALAALLVITLGRRPVVWLYAFLVAAAGLAAVLVYRYVDVGAFGPFPNMYEPLWYAEKTRSAIAEAIGTGTAFAGLLLTRSLVTRRRADR